MAIITSRAYQAAIDAAADLIVAITGDGLDVNGIGESAARKNLKRSLRDVNKAVKEILDN